MAEKKLVEAITSMNEDYIISEIDKRIHSKNIRSFKTVQIKKAMLGKQRKIPRNIREKIVPKRIFFDFCVTNSSPLSKKKSGKAHLITVPLPPCCSIFQ